VRLLQRFEAFARRQIDYAVNQLEGASLLQRSVREVARPEWFGVTAYGPNLKKAASQELPAELAGLPFPALPSDAIRDWVPSGKLGWTGDVRHLNTNGIVELVISSHHAMKVEGVFTYGRDIRLTGWFLGQDLLWNSSCSVPWCDRVFELLELEHRGLVLEPGVQMRFTLAR